MQGMSPEHSNIVSWGSGRRSTHEVRGKQDNGCPGDQGIYFKEEGEIEGAK